MQNIKKYSQPIDSTKNPVCDVNIVLGIATKLDNKAYWVPVNFILVSKAIYDINTAVPKPEQKLSNYPTEQSKIRFGSTQLNITYPKVDTICNIPK